MYINGSWENHKLVTQIALLIEISTFSWEEVLLFFSENLTNMDGIFTLDFSLSLYFVFL